MKIKPLPVLILCLAALLIATVSFPDRKPESKPAPLVKVPPVPQPFPVQPESTAPHAVIEKIEQTMQGRERVAALYQVACDWAKSDPHAAAEWVATLKNDPVYDNTVQGFLNGWASVAPADAANWISTQPGHSEVLQNAAAAVAATWAKSEPKAATEWAEEFAEETENSQPYQKAVTEWAEQNLEEALAHVDHSTADTQLQGYMRIGMLWAQNDPAAAAEWAAGLSSARNQHGALTAVAGIWSKTAPSDAAAFVDEINDATVKGTASRVIMGNWMESDMVGASNWLSTFPPGDARDDAVTEFGNRLAGSDPERALQWSITIDSPELRDFQTEVQLQIWLSRDPAAARQWIQTQPGISPDVIERAEALAGN